MDKGAMFMGLCLIGYLLWECYTLNQENKNLKAHINYGRRRDRVTS